MIKYPRVALFVVFAFVACCLQADAQQITYRPLEECRPAYPSAGTPGSYSGMSPYQQQELALKESRMLQELEELKNCQENSESFRSTSALGTPGAALDQSISSSESSRGGLRRALSKVGSVLKTGARVVAPAAASIGASIGTAFVMRAALGPNAAYAYPGMAPLMMPAPGLSPFAGMAPGGFLGSGAGEATGQGFNIGAGPTPGSVPINTVQRTYKGIPL